MSDIYEEYGLELEAEDIPAESYGSPDSNGTAKKRKGGGWLKAIIAFFLGLVIALGAVGGGGYFVLTQPVGPTLEWVGDMAKFDYETEIKNKYLSEEYEDKTLLELMTEMLSVLKEKKLKGLDNISPAVGDYLGKMVDNMNTQFGVAMDNETILNTEFAELPTYLGDTFRTTPLGNMLKATSKTDHLEPVLMEICYGQEGTHYYVDETTGEVVMMEGHEAATFETLGTSPNSLINNISFAAVLPPKADDSLMMSIAYGRETVTYVLEKDADGNVLLDENGQPLVTMLPLYFEKDEEGNWVDYMGSPILCNVEEPDENGFQKLETWGNFEGAGTDTYYVKETNSDGKYYAYKTPADDAEPALFRKTMIGNLAEDSSALINNIMLKDALHVNYETEPFPHPILFSLAYGTEGVDYVVNKVDPDNQLTWTIEMINDAQPRTIGDLRERGNDIINDVAISDIMSAEPDDALGMYLLYGKENIHYSLDADNNITLLQKYIAISDDATSVYNEYGEYLHPDYYVLDTENATFTDANGITYKYVISDPVKTVKANDGTGQVKVYYLTDMEGNAVKFPPHSLGELAGGDNLISRLTDRLTMSEVLGGDLSEHKMLKHVCDYPINEIPDAISDLSITDMFSEEIYGADAIKYEGDTPLTDAYGQQIENGDYYFEIEEGYEKAALNGKWKYLLVDSVDNSIDGGDYKPQDYKVTEMNRLLDNMTANVDKATLNELHEDQILNGLDGLITTPIQREIKYYDGAGTLHTYPFSGIPEGATTLGELTVSQMLNYTTQILAAPIFGF